jgi:hypothetical protein
VVGVAGGIWAARSGERGDVAPAKAATETAATVRFEVVVQPADATLSFDGKPLGVNPFVGQLARDTVLHQLAASAPGYQPSVQMVTLERDASFHLSLAKVTPTAAPPAPLAPPASAVAAPEAIEPAGGGRRAGIASPAGPRPRPTVVRPPGPRAPPPPPPPPVETKPPGDGKRALDTGALDARATSKRALDTGVLDAPATGKRALDTDVLDSGSNKPKPALDRETPWGN